MSVEADLWQPRTVIEARANTQSVEQRFVAADAQSLFVLTDFVYALGTGALEVYRDGHRLIRGVDFVEQSDATFSLVTPATAGQIILAVGFTGITGSVSTVVTDIYVATHQNLRDYAGVQTSVYVQGKLTAGDSGEGFFQKKTGAAVGYYVDNGENILVPTGGDGSVGWVKVHTKNVSVGMFGADTTGGSLAVAAFQSAVDATPNSGVQRVRVEPGTYLGDMTTLNYGLRTAVVFVEDGGPVTYSTVAPVNRIRTSSNGLFEVDLRDSTSYVPFGIRAELDIYETHVAGNPWASLFTINLRNTSGSNENSAIVARAINHGTSDDNARAIDAVGRDTTEGNSIYGAPYPITPVAHNGAVISYEGNTFRTNVFDDSGKRGIGMQLTAGGGTECANGIEISATQNTLARTHDGLAQAGGASTITLASTADAVDNFYNNRLVTIIAGTGIGQLRKITGYVGATKVATVDSAWTVVPDVTSQYLVFDSYWTGMWRRGIKIWENSLNPDLGVGLYVQSKSHTAVLVEGDTINADFAVVRTSANRSKMGFTCGVQTGEIFTTDYFAGDSAAAASAVQYAKMQVVISDNTAGAQSGYIRFYPTIAGAATSAGYAFKIGAGVVLGNSGVLNEMGISTFNINGGYYHTNLKVVGARRVGWTAATGTATRTTFDTATVTLPVLAEHVKALLDDLTTHGLIGV